MTGKFTPIDPVRCAHYARFFSNLNLMEANGIYWTLFVLNLILLYISSRQHHKSVQLEELDNDLTATPRQVTKRRASNRAQRKIFLGTVGICFLMSIACVTIEVFAAFNIQYCDGEDLMQLYWSFWSVIQVGSIIAQFGVMLQLWMALSDVSSPSWAVALGTPVLVIAALAYAWDFTVRRAWRKFWNKEPLRRTETQSNSSDEDIASNMEQGMSRVDTSVTERPPVQDFSSYNSTAAASLDLRRDGSTSCLLVERGGALYRIEGKLIEVGKGSGSLTKFVTDI